MGNKLSPVIIIVLIVVIIALAGLAVSMLSSKDGGGIIGGNKASQGSNIIPTIEATVNTTDADQEKVIISVVVATDDELGIDAIILPDGTEVNGETKDYTVTKNGTYNFTVRGKNGEENSTSVEINNIRVVSAQNPYIPEGFEHIGGDVDNGFVIQDTYGNQFVWVPVPTGIMTRNTMLSADFEESNTTSSELVNSVAKNYGYYIARFEASSFDINGEKAAASMAGKIPWTNITFTDAYQASLNMSTAFKYAEGIKTAIVNSYAWDTALEWINKNTPNYSTNTGFGNYSGTIYPTGQTASDVVNNICDMAGNVREWTTEIDKSKTASSGNTSRKNTTQVENTALKRTVRGGSANLNKTASSHIGYYENLSDGYWGFRTILYQ
mgnify:CR=1 FL=1